ncbi:MAG: aminotransferase class I/II-fold pyridoxal phosphate-dependent enzyme [Cellulosilyticaceae bacterium]
MEAPLYDALVHYSKTKHPFHMPGHKLGSFGDMKSLDLTALDVTEANGLDNLYEAEGIIKEAMEKLSGFYGSEDTIMLTNGSTAGILASILTVCKPGEKLLVARNCHHSVWHGLILSGAVPIYINPQYDEETGLLTVLPKEEVERALEKHPDCKGAIIVSPTYEGITSDVQGIAEILHEKDKCLIVDEAHGAHFEVAPYFPVSSLKLGADIVIHSMHKTLPTLTQSALMHLGSNRISKEQLIKSLRMVQTSSPSYVMMAVMDYMRAYIETHRETIEKDYIRPLEASRVRLKEMKYLTLLDQEKDYDKGKLVVFTHRSSIDGETLATLLEEKYQLVCEATLPQGVILMTTLADNEKTLKLVTEVLIEIDQTLSKCDEDVDTIQESVDLVRTSRTLSPRDVYYSETTNREVEMCKGYVCKEHIMMYPPGIPLVCIGEVFDEEHIALIKRWQHRLKGIHIENGNIICKVGRSDLE